jgi:hypothetical protein
LEAAVHARSTLIDQLKRGVVTATDGHRGVGVKRIQATFIGTGNDKQARHERSSFKR